MATFTQLGEKGLPDKKGWFTMEANTSTNSPEATLALENARAEAESLGHNFIASEHVLLGILRSADIPAAKRLQERGVTRAKVRSAVRFIHQDEFKGKLAASDEENYTPRLKKSFEWAAWVASSFNLSHVTDDMLLASILLQDTDTLAYGILQSLNVDFDKLFTEILEVLLQSGSESSASMEEGHLDLLHEVVMNLPMISVRRSINNKIELALLLQESHWLSGEVWPVVKTRPYLFDYIHALAKVRLQVNEEIYGECPPEGHLRVMARGHVEPSEHALRCPACQSFFRALLAEFKR